MLVASSYLSWDWYLALPLLLGCVTSDLNKIVSSTTMHSVSYPTQAHLIFAKESPIETMLGAASLCSSIVLAIFMML